MSGKQERSAMWAAQRKVRAWWVVSGAPKRMRRKASTGVARSVVRVRERRAGCINYFISYICM